MGLWDQHGVLSRWLAREGATWWVWKSSEHKLSP